MTLFCRGRLIQLRTNQKNPLKYVYDLTLPLWMNQAKTIWKIFLKIANHAILSLWMSKARTIELSPRRIQNDPICRIQLKLFGKIF